ATSPAFLHDLTMVAVPFVARWSASRLPGSCGIYGRRVNVTRPSPKIERPPSRTSRRKHHGHVIRASSRDPCAHDAAPRRAPGKKQRTGKKRWPRNDLSHGSVAASHAVDVTGRSRPHGQAAPPVRRLPYDAGSDGTREGRPSPPVRRRRHITVGSDA